MSSLEVTIMMNNMMSGMMRSVACQVIDGCAAKYGFNAEEAKLSLNLNVSQAAKKLVGEKPKKEAKAKAAFPLPFNGEHSDTCCQALRQNNGLYTQCQATRKGDATYCKSCQQLADKSANGIPEYGTISMRLAATPYDYVDPKGRKPTSYTKIMKKYNLTQEQVLEEAGKFGIHVDVAHFAVPEETKRGRPAKAPKEPKEAKAVKGRPKKSTKIIALADDEEDLFASLVAQASASEEQEIDKEAKKTAKKAAMEAEKEAKKLAVEAEKEAKKAALEAEKEAKKLAVEAEKAAKKAALEAEKEAKKLALEQEKAVKAEKLAQEKEAKKAALEAEKAAKAEKLAQTKKAPKAKKTEDSLATPLEEEEETYKKCTGQDGKKYIRSQQTNIVYDLDIYTAKEELVPVGKWNADTKTIVFNKADDSDSELEDEEVDE
jgi:hypothetical protein